MRTTEMLLVTTFLTSTVNADRKTFIQKQSNVDKILEYLLCYCYCLKIFRIVRSEREKKKTQSKGLTEPLWCERPAGRCHPSVTTFTLHKPTCTHAQCIIELLRLSHKNIHAVQHPYTLMTTLTGTDYYQYCINFYYYWVNNISY